MSGFLNISPEEFAAAFEEYFRPKPNVNYFRVISPTHDSGWLVTGYYVEDNVKYYARTREIRDEAYYLTKKDFFEVTSPTSAVDQSKVPLPVWSRQPPWNNNFPLPPDLLQQPKEQPKEKKKKSRNQNYPDMSL